MPKWESMGKEEFCMDAVVLTIIHVGEHHTKVNLKKHSTEIKTNSNSH